MGPEPIGPCPFKKGGFGHRQPCTEGRPVKAQGEHRL